MNLKSTIIKKPELTPAPDAVAVEESDEEIWNIKAVTLFRALGYVIGLPSFMVGTALFMLGFSVTDSFILILPAYCIASLLLLLWGGQCC